MIETSVRGLAPGGAAKEVAMGFDRDIPQSRIRYWRLQGALLCLLAEILLFAAWMAWQVWLGLAWFAWLR